MPNFGRLILLNMMHYNLLTNFLNSFSVNLIKQIKSIVIRFGIEMSNFVLIKSRLWRQRKLIIQCSFQ